MTSNCPSCQALTILYSHPQGGSDEVSVTGFLEPAAVPLGEPSQADVHPSPTLPMSAFAGYVARLVAPPLALSAAQVRVLAGFAALIAIWSDVLFHRSEQMG